MKKSILRSLLATGLLLGLSLPAHANGFSAVINGKSIHLDSTYDWNEANVGLGIEYMLPTDARWRKVLFANGFRDSMDEMTYMAGGGIHRRLFESERFAGLYMDAGINLFVMTRDDVEGGRPFPGVLPSLTFGNRYVGMNLTYMPRKAVQEFVNAEFIDPSISGIVFLQFKISVDQLLPSAD
ncbi:MAG: hypothetical protein OEW73_00480 [Gammaproteobacteria bacterium]|nr:hypothetical protein [Gammaproteobacteria bacterium]MDH5239237.1 hypothetical protein [Gammaproteobacteria bacterium]MDH5259898.1 hypothetical protein [Gammaproteobacteria bacterium]